MTAIQAASIRCRTMADGTLRLELDVEPRDAQAAFRLFGSPGTAVALAAIKPDAQQEAPEKPKGGAAAKWLGQMCGDAAFVLWLATTHGKQWSATYEMHGADTAKHAAATVRAICEVQSRAEIDNDPAAFARFEERIRRPWIEATRERG